MKHELFFAVLQASCGQVEVVGTTHATTGVRRLVKSVVRGLKACQVSTPCPKSTLDSFHAH